MIEFIGSIGSGRTSIDGGFKIVFDLPESQAVEFAKLLALRNLVLNVSVKPAEET